MSGGYTKQVYSLKANQTTPAEINCLVRCLNHSGIYSPALLVVKPKEAMFTSLRQRNRTTVDYSISYRSISTCQASNNYTMEFEYYVYAFSARLDDALFVCGVVHPHTAPPCWGQSYAVIDYNPFVPTTPPTTDSTTLVTSSNTVQPTFSYQKEAERYQTATFTLVGILALIIVLVIILPIIAAVVMILKCNKDNRICPERH